MVKYSMKKGMIVFGTGAVYQRNISILKRIPIIALLDNNIEKRGKFINGVKIYLPGELEQLEYDIIVLMSDYWTDMRSQLLKLGVPSDKIIAYGDLGRYLYDIEDRTETRRQYKEKANEYVNESARKALLASSEMSLTGASIILYYAALILQKRGYKVTVVCPKDDMLSSYYKQNNIDVICDSAMHKNNKDFWNLVDICDICIINTIVLKELIYGVNQVKTECVWWIHESDERCSTVDDKDLVKSFTDNLSIYGVGKRVLNTLNALETWEGCHVENLLYGIPDDRFEGNISSSEGEKIIIALVGSIYVVKGQDIFVDSIKGLPPEIRNRCEFRMIGNILDNRFFDNIVKNAEGESCIHFMGIKTREEMKEIYSEIDILVCPSRRDTLPVVTIEAMMNEKLCIVSEITGTASYIQDGVNGYIVKTEDVAALSEKIQYTVENHDELDHVRKAARETFERHFSMESFEMNLIRVIEDNLSK